MLRAVATTGHGKAHPRISSSWRLVLEGKEKEGCERWMEFQVHAQRQRDATASVAIVSQGVPFSKRIEPRRSAGVPLYRICSHNVCGVEQLEEKLCGYSMPE